MSRARNLSRFKPASTGLIEAANITSGTITNTQINSSAAIAQSKMAALAAANMPTGSIVQVVTNNTAAQVENTTDGGSADLMSVTITPTSASNKIMIMITGFFGQGNPNGAVQLVRGSTSIAEGTGSFGGASGYISYDDQMGSQYTMESHAFHFVDTPNTTSATTYLMRTSSHTTVYFNRSRQASSGRSSSTITAMEIKG
jgi:hypothetical protein